MKTGWSKYLRLIGLAVWLVATILLLQHAVASRVELQPRAALISWILVILLALPVVLVLIRQRRRKRDD